MSIQDIGEVDGSLQAAVETAIPTSVYSSFLGREVLSYSARTVRIEEHSTGVSRWVGGALIVDCALKPSEDAPGTEDRILIDDHHRDLSGNPEVDEAVISEAGKMAESVPTTTLFLPVPKYDYGRWAGEV